MDIVYITDDGCISILSVAMTLLIENANKNLNLNFHILTLKGFKKESKEKLEKVAKINARGSSAIYYKMMIPEIMQRKKCLYMDGDIDS